MIMRRFVLLSIVVLWSGQAGAVEGNLMPTLYTLPAAAAADDLATVKQDLAQGDNVNLVDSATGRTALSYAAINGDVTMVALLLQNRARVDYKDKLGDMPLHWAAQKGNDAVVPLLDAGAPIDAQNQQGATPLMLAAEAGKLDAVRTLVARKANLSVRDFTGRTALDIAQSNRRTRVEQFLRSAGGGP